MNFNKKAAVVLIITGIIFFSGSISKRIDIENSNRYVEIIPETGLLAENAEAQVIKEFNLQEWIDRSYAGKWQPGVQVPFTGSKAGSVILIFDREDLYRHALKVLQLKLESPLSIEKSDKNYYIKIDNAIWDEISHMGMGLLIPQEKTSRRVYIRPLNDPWVDKEYIKWFFEDISAEGIIFRGSEVMGYPLNLDAVRKEIKEKDIKVFSIEFAQQKGLKKLSSGLKLCRLHSIPENLMPGKMISRAVRAVKERGIRSIYLKSRRHEASIAELRSSIENQGYISGSPLGIEIVSGHNMLYALGVVICLIGLSFLYTDRMGIVLISGAVMAAGLAVLYPVFRQVLILLISIYLPFIAVSHAVKKDTGLLKSIIVFFILSIFAGILISAVTAQPSFYIKLDQVRGIKLALVIPLMIGAWIVYREKEGCLKQGVRWEDLSILIFLAAVGIIYILRSSNTQTGLVTGIELRIRLLLEKIFIYRPRFKEIAIGHPLLIAGLYFFKNKISNFRYSKLFIVIGLVGQLSIINTFMHVHSPLQVSFLRVFYGIIIGSISGLLLIEIIKKCQISAK
ncbi:DUF5693 family protein [Elusimicrobiota bacterium]